MIVRHKLAIREFFDGIVMFSAKANIEIFDRDSLFKIYISSVAATWKCRQENNCVQRINKIHSGDWVSTIQFMFFRERKWCDT